ncbi:MAG: acetyl-CoA carboxylase biotin carboxyl carrier protein subunit [Ruminococcaceae bacterium]|nr:acetyl-CoA carboxylase biotin carboxyl carrier protein subunit [Oscillospiraceae bacterium]
MIRKYVVTIDSNKYEVEVEENGVVKSNKEVVVAAPVVASAPAVAPAPTAPASAAPAAPVAVPADGNKVTSPLPGTLLKLVAKQGATVAEGDLLCVIEAMKMENEIRSPYNGTVTSVIASEGAMLNAGDVILVIA